MGTLPEVCALCSTCGEALNSKGVCLFCLLRAGLDGSFENAARAFGDFEITRREDGSAWELGRGAMGVTYRAVDKVLHRYVALKVIESPATSAGSRVARERFLREACNAAVLQHPNVASVFYFGASTETERCYLAMELIDGETLEARVRRAGPLSIESTIEIAIQVTRALIAAGARELIHRDLKPGNIMLMTGESVDDVTVKVIDFGLAKAAAETNLTPDGFVGTPAFASPEQFGKNAIDARSDIYSLGITIWYALTGRLPFPGRTAKEIRDQQASGELPIAQLIARKIPATTIALLRSMLARDPAERPASARDLLVGLESCRARLTRPNDSAIRRKWAALLAIALLIAAGPFVFRAARQPSAPLPVPEKSIAVLPFENLSKGEENAFFAVGVQDEILSDLARIADLKVISRTSVMKYRSGDTLNVRELGKTLGVANVVEGSVQRFGNRVRVVAQLIDTRTDSHLWGETYDRQVTDIFAIQSEIAQQIADQLGSKLSPAEKERLTERPTSDLPAFALYEEARGLGYGKLGWGNWDGAIKTFQRKLGLLQQATQRDPKFALAYCGIAQTEEDIGENSGDITHWKLAKAAVDTALRLRPDLGETHLELARYLFYTGEFDQARSELAIAQRTLPNNSVAFFIAGRLDRRQNRWEESLANLRKASALDPRSSEIVYHIGCDLLGLRRYREGDELIEKDNANDTEPDQVSWHRLELAEIRLAEGNPIAAQALLDQVPLNFSPTLEVWSTRFKTALYLRDYDSALRTIVATPDGADILPGMMLDGRIPKMWAEGLIASSRGDRKKATAIFSQARELAEAESAPALQTAWHLRNLSQLASGLGRKEDAIREAQRAVDLVPIAKDSWLGPDLVTNLAMVYAWNGDREHALDQLEIAAKVPFGTSYGDLRFSPYWDSLRGNSRFEQLVASLQPKTVASTK